MFKETGMGKTALITGASRGIGKAIARNLGSQGYDLFLTCINNKEVLDSFANELAGEYGINCKSFVCDMSDSKAVNMLFDAISELDILINNAGISYVGLLQDMSDEDWDKVINTNLSSIFYTCRRAVPIMLKKGVGKIINISSMLGNVGASTEVAYSASKGGMNAFTKALAKELAPSNISVNAISCGVIDTDMNKCFTIEEREALAEEIPYGRFASPEEVSELVNGIILAPNYMTGQIIGIDGGYI